MGKPNFKSRVTLKALQGEQTLAELAGRTPDEAYHGVPTSEWRYNDNRV